MIFLSIILALIFSKLILEKISIYFITYISAFSAVLTFFAVQHFLGYQIEDLSVFYTLSPEICISHVMICCMLLLLAYLIAFLVKREVLYSNKKKKPKSKKQIFARIGLTTYQFILGLLFFIGVLFFFSCHWVVATFGNIGVNQVLYQIQEPLAGTANQQLFGYIFTPLNNALIVLFIYLFIVKFMRTYRISKKPKLKRKKRQILYTGTLTILVLGSLGLTAYSGLSLFGLDNLKAAFIEKSELFENYYVSPQNVQVTFPKKKRNLIYIFVESLETTYISKDLGGTQEVNLMPNLSKLAEENTNFSNTKQLGGAMNFADVGFTAGAMIGQTSGTPVKVDIKNSDGSTVNANDYGQSVKEYMPGAYSIGEYLEKEGYNQELLLGSDAKFGGRDKYFSQHGNYTISDYDTAMEKGWIPKGYHVWWGYEDEKLFEIAKQRLADLASKDEPFNLTLLTADTHFEDGYMTANTPKLFDDQYSNVIHWSDQMIAEFIKYIQQQPYYKDTTIVLSGDHLSMGTKFFKSVPDDYDRTVFNLIMNSPVTTDNTKNRQFSTMDLFPTTLAALGCTIQGERLGLGTNLYSNKQTLVEQLGYDKLNLEMQKKSPYYNDHIMNGK